MKKVKKSIILIKYKEESTLKTYKFKLIHTDYFRSYCSLYWNKFSGDDYIEEIPVPIPNTEVKLYCAEDICGLPRWENRLSPVYIPR